ncbi:lytic murein transglycosylase B [Methylotuvimicrobium sp.]|uniref:lytic murein transglycosylase B n=1 Tax=Methylotuvimicrobium sp. TaxID=2822413 RepID=UPI003D660CD5
MYKKLAVIILMLTGCSSTAQQHSPFQKSADKASDPVVAKPIAKPSLQPKQIGPYRAASVSGDYAGYSELRRFIDEMVLKHGFNRDYLNGLFSQAKRKQWTLDYLHKSDQASKSRAEPAPGGWTRYRAKFLDERHINSGVSFWMKHGETLRRAEDKYGVPAEYILGILGVETSYGGYIGNHRIIDALTTLAFDYKRRGDYFRGELENFLIMAGKEGFDPSKPVGSFAGAMGLGQFMPTSFLKWAVDFNGNGRKDLWSPEDAIGSVANYFAQHGWQSGQPIVTPAKLNGAQAHTLETGVNHQYTLPQFKQAGVIPARYCQCDGPLHLVLLRKSIGDDYWIGHRNFYVITRYNQSSYYAMAVHDLAMAIKSRYRKTQMVSR